MKSFVILFFTMCLVHTVYSKSLASYLEPCKAHDPDFKKCSLEHALKAYPILVKGDKKLGVPILGPKFVLPTLTLDTGSLKVSFSDFQIEGLDTGTINEAYFDLDKKLFTLKVHIPRMNFEGPYVIDGKVLVLPIKGTGKSNITFVGGDYHYTFNYKLVDNKGKQVVKRAESDFTLKIQRAYFHFENLFGDKALSEQMNTFLNENWTEVMKDLGKGIADAVRTIADDVISKFLGDVPENEIFVL